MQIQAVQKYSLLLPILAGMAFTARAATPAGATIYTKGIAGTVPACIACHGKKGQGIPALAAPRLAGLPRPYFLQQLQAFQKGKRQNPIMAPVAIQLKPVEAEVLAAYLSALPMGKASASSATSEVQNSGRLLASTGDAAHGIPACTGCHGPKLLGGGPLIPPLAGQLEHYLIVQLNQFHTGARQDTPLNLMQSIASKLTSKQIQAVSSYIANLEPGSDVEIPRKIKADWKSVPQDPDSFAPPPETVMPITGDYGEMLLLGERIFDNTPKYAGKYVGNSLSCRNCHIDRGRNPASSPLWAAVPKYPEYRDKNKRVNTLIMRLQGCFRFSENGTPPPADSKEIVALVSYSHWLATGLPTGITPKASGYPKIAKPREKPDVARGARIYQSHCAICHGDNGAGTMVAGDYVFPALWGPNSFNKGAGMYKVRMAAAFIKANMPFSQGGSLSDQQAWDVAAFVNSHARPKDPRLK